jgi:hypothetical protein
MLLDQIQTSLCSVIGTQEPEGLGNLKPRCFQHPAAKEQKFIASFLKKKKFLAGY